MTNEQLIAEGALKRAKDIVDNKDFWSGPGAAKTSGEAVVLLLDVARTAGRPSRAETPVQVAATYTPKPAPAKPETTPKANGESESTQA